MTYSPTDCSLPSRRRRRSVPPTVLQSFSFIRTCYNGTVVPYLYLASATVQSSPVECHRRYLPKACIRPTLTTVPPTKLSLLSPIRSNADRRARPRARSAKCKAARESRRAGVEKAEGGKGLDRDIPCLAVTCCL